MALSKKVKIGIGIGAALLAIGGLVIASKNSGIKDKFGNKFKLDAAGQIFVNGVQYAGNLKAIELGADGLVYGTNFDGGRYVWTDNKFNYV